MNLKTYFVSVGCTRRNDVSVSLVSPRPPEHDQVGQERSPREGRCREGRPQGHRRAAQAWPRAAGEGVQYFQFWCSAVRLR